jgi:hypothetical protein
VWLLPRPESGFAAVGRAAVACGLVGGAVGYALHQPGALALAVGMVGAGALALGHGTGAVRLPLGARALPMAITPWGIVVTPETEPRILRWPAIRRVEVVTSHAMQGGTPAALESVVTVRVGREVLAGRTFGEAGLEGLTANLEAYADEASRPLAGDLDGEASVGDGPTDAVVEELLGRARELCGSADGADRLSLAPGGYRDVASRAAAPETIALLRHVLSDAHDGADPRAFAALVAGELQARALTPELLRLATSPHPVVAATARAAAIRLGAPPNRAGALEEVAVFLEPADLAELERWSG